jgi:hypothetical protein
MHIKGIMYKKKPLKVNNHVQVLMKYLSAKLKDRP